MTRHTYDNASITIGGVAMGPIQMGQVVVQAGEVEHPAGSLPRFKPYEATFTMTLNTADPLDELAAQVVCTPSLDASAALDVLVDALIERGRFDSPLQVFFTPEAWARRRRSVAFAWAQDQAYGPFWRLVQYTEEQTRKAILRPPPSLETASDEALDLYAEHVFGLYRLEQPRGELETDEDLRERCRALLQGLSLG